MREVKILSPTAILGYGFPEASFERGLAEKPNVIAVDAGSIDPGPYYIGAGKPFVSRQNVKRDLNIILPAAIKKRIPLLIGTAGGSGAKVHVNWCLSIIKEITESHHLQPKVAVIYSDVKKSIVKKGLQAGKIHALPFVSDLTLSTISRTPRIVAQMGVEPILNALKKDVDVVVCGRCYDPAIFAALPVKYGFDMGLSLHLGKILECAAIAAVPGSGKDCVLGILKKNRFILKPLSKKRKFTVDSVVAHTLYEKSNPQLLPGPGGTLDLSKTTFKQLDSNCVEVRGSKFIPANEYTVKLEGATLVGYRTIAICGIRDGIMIDQLDDILENIKKDTWKQFNKRKHHLNFRIYGKNGVMGNIEPVNVIRGHEVGIIIEAIASSQKEANALCGFVRSTLLHCSYPNRISTAGNLAIPFSPSDIPMGKVYEFSIHHLLKIENPENIFSVNIMER